MYSNHFFDFITLILLAEIFVLMQICVVIIIVSLYFIFQAKAQRANVLLKMGRLDEAHIDAENVLRKDPEHEDANRVYAEVEVMKVNTSRLGIPEYLSNKFNKIPLSDSCRKGFKMRITISSIRTTRQS